METIDPLNIINKDYDQLNKLRIQLEYYFSDINLEKDKFYYDKINSHPEGYIDIDIILNGRKMKEWGVTKDQIIRATKMSNLIELDEKTCEKLRRKENKPLPELKSEKPRIQIYRPKVN